MRGVKNQGSCGSCWAFAVTAALECLYTIKTGTSVDLSPQELVDCGGYGQFGCRGGDPAAAFDNIKLKLGISAWRDYPYVGKENWICYPVRYTMGIRNWDFVEPRKERALKAAVAERPVVVALNGNSTAFYNYRGGVFRGPCTTVLTHAMLLVGYNTTVDGDPYGEPAGVDFWILKNSWSTAWGEAGYMRLLRGDEKHGGVCGVMIRPVYPMDPFDLTT
ncbi:vignain-like [Lolium rigidum]|uniref:vignain-like n=1 Tax=Lolium rigidum TaxID=89674 RepID=UPI001F5C9BD6|nr:vignain-like [Lolium rigidum]